VADRQVALRPVHGIDALGPADGRLFVVVGVFDGIHRGHLYLLDHLRSAATARGARPTVITFDHHPDEILTGSAPPLLCDPDERLERLAASGVEVTVVQHFDQALRMTGYDAFIRRIADRVDLAGFLMTPDAAFGHERRGTPEAVGLLGATMGFDVQVLPPLDLGGRPVRSTEIRTAIAAGRLDTAALLLGRPYAVVGEGSEGNDVIGRDDMTLRFPMPVALPPAGDYPVRISSADTPTEDGRSGGEGTAVIDRGGRMRLHGSPVSEARRLRVTFG